MNIGEKIKLRRNELGISQEELAFKMGYNGRSTIAKIESGAVEVAHTKVLQYAKILGVSVDYLLGTADCFDEETSNVSTNNSRSVFAANLQYYVKISGFTQKEIAEELAISTATFSDWLNGKKFPRIDKIEKLANFFGVSKSDLIENNVNEAETSKADSLNVFPKNLRLLMAKAKKSRKEVSKAIGVSYFTFSDWCNGKKYPRIEKLQSLAKYFGVTAAELVGEQQAGTAKTETAKTSEDSVLDIVIRLHTDKEFLTIVEEMSALDSEKLKALKQFLLAFSEKRY